MAKFEGMCASSITTDFFFNPMSRDEHHTVRIELVGGTSISIELHEHQLKKLNNVLGKYLAQGDIASDEVTRLRKKVAELETARDDAEDFILNIGARFGYQNYQENLRESRAHAAAKKGAS